MDEDFYINDPKEDDLVIVTATIANWQVRKVLINWGRFVEVLYWSTFQKLDIFTTLIESYPNALGNEYTPKGTSICL